MVTSFKLSVCPHDTAKNLLGWFTLNTYLQRKLGAGIHFEPQDSFLVERQAVLDDSFQVVYANPYSALVFARGRGFVPVARPAGVKDETLVVARAGVARYLKVMDLNKSSLHFITNRIAARTLPERLNGG